MRRAAKTDANHAIIVTFLRQCHCSVLDLSGVGGGCPDLLVAARGHNILVEIKDGSKRPSERKLNTLQKVWHNQWKGPVVVVESVDDALRLVRG